jgi:succinate dehydrogenase / fumarate reductase iron-sulfur subunit
MIINGRVRQACSALVDKLGEPGAPVTLEPMTKFPLVRDLMVDRSRIFNDLKRVKAWVPIDGTYDLGPGPTISQEVQEMRYPLSRCITCGCCMEACPQYRYDNNFVGAAIMTMTRLFNSHPVGAALKDERLDTMMGPGGVSECSKAGNCVVVCPKLIPNLESIADVQRQVTVHAVKKFFSGK